MQMKTFPIMKYFSLTAICLTVVCYRAGRKRLYVGKGYGAKKHKGNISFVTNYPEDIQGLCVKNTTLTFLWNYYFSLI